MILLWIALSCAAQNPISYVPDADNQVFRNEVIKFVRAAAIRQLVPQSLVPINNLDTQWNNHYQRTNWQVTITAFHDGQQVGQGQASGKSLVTVLKTATEKALHHINPKQLTETTLDDYRFAIDFDYFPSQRYSLIEYQTKGLELLGNRVAVRRLTVDAIRDQLHQSQGYLLRSVNPKLGGLIKFYNAESDERQSLLRTVYSASTLYTLIQLSAWNHDVNLTGYFDVIGYFILSNQVTTGPNAGGFYYGLDSITQQKVCRVVVGTASKVIFTLLELHRLYPKNPIYMKSATKAANWLLTRINAQGEVMPIADCSHGQWEYSQRQSLLYSGQVLSALSRMYAKTGEKRYYQGAQKIANHFVSLVAEHGPLLGDDYRPANSISSSWVLMSLIDFAKINSKPQYRADIEKLTEVILGRQITNPNDAYNNGRYLDAMTSSGNGWINEVMGVAYAFCIQEKQPHCQRYYEAMRHTSRWLLQNAYTAASSYNVKNPANALGGFITNFNAATVRTDAVCHAVNSLVMFLQYASKTHETLLMSLPERPLREVLPLLRAGV